MVNKKRLLQFLFLITIGVASLFFHGTSCNATSIFSVFPVANEHQVGSDTSYFNLLEEPGEKDILKVKITNPSKEAQKFMVTLTDGNTNDEGQIDYSGTKENSKQLKASFTDIAKNPQSMVEVGKESTKTIEIPVTMPKASFYGVILGGITIREVNPKAFNTYSYTIGVVLMNHRYASINKKKSMQKEEIEYDKNQEAFIVHLINPSGFLSTDNELEIEVKNMWGQKVYSYEKEDIDIAPHQEFSMMTDQLSHFFYRWELHINEIEKTFYSLHFGDKVIYCSPIQLMVPVLVLLLIVVGIAWFLVRRYYKEKLN